MEKECKKHGLTLFSYRKGEKRWKCRKCVVEGVTKRRKALKRLAIEYKGGKCEICGYNKCSDALDFHHKDPTTKDFSLSHAGLTRSLAKTLMEVDKCMLVCANCHREIHSTK